MHDRNVKMHEEWVKTFRVLEIIYSSGPDGRLNENYILGRRQPLSDTSNQMRNGSELGVGPG